MDESNCQDYNFDQFIDKAKATEVRCTVDKKSLLSSHRETNFLGNPSLIASHAFLYIHFDWRFEPGRFITNGENVLTRFLSRHNSKRSVGWVTAGRRL